MKKKNGFIAISIIYSFFLCFIMLMMGMVANYAHTKLIVNKINEPLTFNKETVKNSSEPENPTDPDNPDNPDGDSGGIAGCYNEPKKLIDIIMEEYEGKIKLSSTLTEDNYIKGEPSCTMDCSGSTCKCSTIASQSTDGLYEFTDENNTKSYVFRGDGTKINNKITFAGYEWVIVRVNGDKTIRLLYVGKKDTDGSIISDAGGRAYGMLYYAGKSSAIQCTQEAPCESNYNASQKTFEFKYKNEVSSIKESNVKTVLETWYKSNLAAYDSKIALTSYCNDASYSSGQYGANTRDNNPILTCPKRNAPAYGGGFFKLKIGLITKDELLIAGVPVAKNNYYTYYTNYIYHSNYFKFRHFFQNHQKERKIVIVFLFLLTVNIYLHQ